MYKFTSRVLLALVCGAIASLAGTSVLGQTAQHRFLQTFRPIPGVELFPDPDFPFGENPSEFGSDVAIRNGLAFAGMPLTLGTGRVAIFKQTATGWVRSGTVTASDKMQGDEFGRAVSFRDNLLVVGSKRAAYVYRQINGVWREQQKIVPPAADGIVRFAPDLKHEAGVLAIGAWGEHGVPNPRVADSVYIYEQDATGKFVRRARILTPSGHQDQFGGSISMTDSIIVVGSGGAAYILARNKSGQWVTRQKLVASNTAAAAGGFGSPVAVDRGMILVSASAEFVPDPTSEFGGVFGEVYGFLPGATKYVESFRLRPLGPVAADFSYGMEIAISGNRIAVAGISSLEGEGAEGAAVAIYSRVGNTVSAFGGVSLTSSRPLTLVTSVAIANNLLLVGSPFAGRCLFNDSCVGEANLFRMDPTTD
jgi:hypothetical protein